MDSLLLHSVEKNSKAAHALYLQIKEFKKFRMKQFLEFSHDDQDTTGFTIHSRWPVKPLEALTDTTAGIKDGPRDGDYFRDSIREEGLPVFDADCIEKLRFTAKQFRHVGKEFREQYTEYLTGGGDILLAPEGTSPGSSAIVPIFHEEGLLGGRCIRIRPNSGICEPFYLLNILHFYYHIGLMETAADKAMGAISAEILKSLPIPAPPLQEQGEITSLMLELSGGMVAQEMYMEELGKLKKIASLHP